MSKTHTGTTMYSACQKTDHLNLGRVIDSRHRCRSVTNYTSFESSRFKDSNEPLFALRGEHYLFLWQGTEKSQVLKSCNYKPDIF